MARRDTIRKSSLSTLPDPDAAIRFRDHLVEHITWIEASHDAVGEPPTQAAS